jgi:hypothetical protein
MNKNCHTDHNYRDTSKSALKPVCLKISPLHALFRTDLELKASTLTLKQKSSAKNRLLTPH